MHSFSLSLSISPSSYSALFTAIIALSNDMLHHLVNYIFVLGGRRDLLLPIRFVILYLWEVERIQRAPAVSSFSFLSHLHLKFGSLRPSRFCARERWGNGSQHVVFAFILNSFSPSFYIIITSLLAALSLECKISRSFPIHNLNLNLFNCTYIVLNRAFKHLRPDIFPSCFDIHAKRRIYRIITS